MTPAPIEGAIPGRIEARVRAEDSVRCGGGGVSLAEQSPHASAARRYSIFFFVVGANAFGNVGAQVPALKPRPDPKTLAATDRGMRLGAVHVLAEDLPGPMTEPSCPFWVEALHLLVWNAEEDVLEVPEPFVRPPARAGSGDLCGELSVHAEAPCGIRIWGLITVEARLRENP